MKYRSFIFLNERIAKIRVPIINKIECRTPAENLCVVKKLYIVLQHDIQLTKTVYPRVILKYACSFAY